MFNRENIGINVKKLTFFSLLKTKLLVAQCRKCLDHLSVEKWHWKTWSIAVLENISDTSSWVEATGKSNAVPQDLQELSCFISDNFFPLSIYWICGNYNMVCNGSRKY